MTDGNGDRVLVGALIGLVVAATGFAVTRPVPDPPPDFWPHVEQLAAEETMP
jgi:hypothetical protein